MLAGDRDRGFGRAAEVHRDMRLLHALHIGKAALEAVEASGVIERLAAGPDPPHHVEIFVGTRVTLVVGEEIAVLALLGVIAAGDDVNGDAPAGELVERRELARRERRRGEARPVRDHESEPLRHRRGMPGHQNTVRRGRVERHESAIEAALLVGLGDRFHIAAVERGPLRRMNFGEFAGADVTDEFNAHDLHP
jgi:hypothetical protein